MLPRLVMLQTSAVSVCVVAHDRWQSFELHRNWMGQNLTKAEKCRDGFFLLSLMFAFPRLLAASLRTLVTPSRNWRDGLGS